jgi:hypothetical protein
VAVAPQRGRDGEADVAGGAREEDLHAKGTAAWGERVPVDGNELAVWTDS